MVALLWIRRGMPSKLPATSAGAMHRNGADRLADGGHLSPDHSPSAPDQPPIAGSLSARRSLRARSTNCHRTAGGTTGPAVGEILPGSGEPPTGEASATRTAVSVHLPPLPGFGCDQSSSGASRPLDGDCTQSAGRKPNLGRSADAADPGEYYAHLLAAGTGRLSIPDSAPAFPRHSHPGHCTGRGSSRGFAGIKNRISPVSMPATGSRWPELPSPPHAQVAPFFQTPALPAPSRWMLER